MIEKGNTPFFSAFTGKLEGIVVYMHRNQRCIRSKPSVRRRLSSPGVLAQQERIAALSIFYRALEDVGMYGCWQKAAEGLPQSGYNLLVKANLPAFSGQGTIGDFSKIQLTEGRVCLPDNLRLQPMEGDRWLLTWNNTPYSPWSKEDDRLWIGLMKDEETFDIEPLKIGDCNREQEQAIFRIPPLLKDYVHLYVVFCSCTDGTCSKSRYFNMSN